MANDSGLPDHTAPDPVASQAPEATGRGHQWCTAVAALLVGLGAAGWWAGSMIAATLWAATMIGVVLWVIGSATTRVAASKHGSAAQQVEAVRSFYHSAMALAICAGLPIIVLSVLLGVFGDGSSYLDDSFLFQHPPAYPLTNPGLRGDNS